jgi:hypothetical protein
MDRTHVDSHLNAWLGAGALKHDVEAVGLAERFENAIPGVLGTQEGFLGRLGLGCGGQTEDLVGETVVFCKRETRLVDVDGDDATCAFCFGEGTGENADGSCAKDEDCLALADLCSPAGVHENGEGFGESGLLEGARIGQSEGEGMDVS